MKKTFILLLISIAIISCKKDHKYSESHSEKIEKTAYLEMSGNWILIDGLCEGGCAWGKPDLSIANFLTIKKDRTYEYRTGESISTGTFVFRYNVRCGSQRSDSTLLFVLTNSGGGKNPPTKDEMMMASSISVKNDTLRLLSPDCMADGKGYRVYKRTTP